MVDTVKALMNYGFRVIYGYTESDEISLLFHPEENTFARKVRKYNLKFIEKILVESVEK